MERAATGCADWIRNNLSVSKKIMIFCGPGNNGGDGLVIARLLLHTGYDVRVFILGNAGKNSADFLFNLDKLQALSNQIELLENETVFPKITTGCIVVDALFGYGLNRPLEGVAKALAVHINTSGAPVIAIDMPSGMFADKSSKDNTVVNATVTLTFQVMKLGLLLPENANITGTVQLIEIGLHPQYTEQTSSNFEIPEEAVIGSYLPPRKQFAHKGNYGSALLIAGSHGMMGAAVLSARACMRSGAGRLTCYIPTCGYGILQTAVPEVMCITGEQDRQLSAFTTNNHYDAYAIGPGIGSFTEGNRLLEQLLDKKPKRLIIDADGLNQLAAAPRLLSKIPAHTLLTPHPKEFERLFGSTANDFERIQLALEKARLLQSFIVIKGKYSFIATPEGKGYFNPTGNPGMATAGSGDVLTGILLGLFAQNSNAEQVCVTGVFLHGLAGDYAAQQKSETAMIAGDIVENLPQAFGQLKTSVYFV